MLMPDMSMAATTSAPFIINITASVASPNFRQMALDAGWNGASPLTVNITAPLVNTLYVPATWSFPGGLTVNVGASTRIGGVKSGGSAIIARQPFTLNNLGTLSGGGGQGGEGSTEWARSSIGDTATGTGGAGGAGQGFDSESSLTVIAAQPGSPGLYRQAAGVGGVGSVGAYAQGGTGGAGGAWGAAGSMGSSGSSGGSDVAASGTSVVAQPGRPAGNYLAGSDYVTWGATGVRQGGVHTGRYRYWRMQFDTLASALTFIGIYELELRSTRGGADLTTPATPVTARLSHQTSLPANVVDNSATTFWAAQWPESDGVWLQVDMGAATAVQQLAITVRASGTTSPPASFRVLGSDDGATFAEIASFAGIAGWLDGQQRLFNV